MFAVNCDSIHMDDVTTCHKWPRICSTCCKNFSVLSSFMAYHWVCNYSNTTASTGGAGTAYRSRI